MKLKQLMMISFLVLTLIPTVIISALLYKSGYSLSKESYTRNMVESINVQADYISQTIEDHMISDYRFAAKNLIQPLQADGTFDGQKSQIYSAFESYLENSEDKISVCILADQQGSPVYTIGEKDVLDLVTRQLPQGSDIDRQQVREFELGEGVYSLGIVTPLWDQNQVYRGCLISVYDNAYIFKIISSYYEIADTFTYMCRSNGEILNYRGLSIENRDAFSGMISGHFSASQEGVLDTRVGNHAVSGSYKMIRNTPWYLVGLLDHKLIYDYINQFIPVYILIIILVLIADIVLAFYISQRVVDPINRLIGVMEDYQNHYTTRELEYREEKGYYETTYLGRRFYSLMKTIRLVQHNFEGIYQLYQSSDMDDTNIDIDVKNQTIQSSKEKFKLLMESLEIPEGCCIVERFIRCFCEKDQVVLSRMFEKMRDEHLSVMSEAELYIPQPNEKWFHVLVVPMYEDERLSKIFIQLRDISNFKIQEFATSEQARKDGLTGLLNRRGFVEQMNQVIRSSGRDDLHGLLFIDMNYFKMVNDTFGHGTGDDLLRAIGTSLSDIVGDHGYASRYGGDEFAVLLPMTSSEAVETMKMEINRCLTYPFSSDHGSFTVSASIGTSIWSGTSKETLDQLLERADASMYQVKREMKQKDSSR